MADLSQPGGLPLWSDYTGFLRRHTLMLGSMMGLGLVVGLVWSLLQPASFSASASIVLAPVPAYVALTTTELVPPEVTIDTDAQLTRSPDVLSAVGGVPDEDADTASRRMQVTAAANSNVLRVTVTAASAPTAAAAADAAAAAFIDVRRHALGALRHNQL